MADHGDTKRVRRTKGYIVGLGILAALLLIIAADYCRVQIAMAQIASTVKVGEPVASIEAKLGTAPRGSYRTTEPNESGSKTYFRLYAWQYPLKYLPIGSRPYPSLPPGYMWTIEHAPSVTFHYEGGKATRIDCASPFYR